MLITIFKTTLSQEEMGQGQEKGNKSLLSAIFKVVFFLSLPPFARCQPLTVFQSPIKVASFSDTSLERSSLQAVWVTTFTEFSSVQ